MYIFCYWHFLIKSLYYVLKWCPIFDSSPFIQNLKFNNFFWICWFLCKNLSNFLPPAWKLHNPYCHSGYTSLVFAQYCLFTAVFFTYSKALKCMFFGEWKNLYSSKLVQLVLLYKAKARSSNCSLRFSLGAIFILRKGVLMLFWTTLPPT